MVQFVAILEPPAADLADEDVLEDAARHADGLVDPKDRSVPRPDKANAIMRTFSYGGGVQSTACLVLAAQGRIDFRTFVFCNVGADSENPDTLDYIERIARPYAEAHGIEFIELHRFKRDGTIDTLWQRLTRPGSRSVPIPVRMANGAPGTRSCTTDFKVRLVASFERERGATFESPSVCGIGISTDEIQRARTASGVIHQLIEYPLIELGLNRADCMEVIRQAGLPVPPKSSCFFCPFHDLNTWRELKRTRPDLFETSVWLERMLTTRRRSLPCPGNWTAPREAYTRIDFSKVTGGDFGDAHRTELRSVIDVALTEGREVIAVDDSDLVFDVYVGGWEHKTGTCRRCRRVYPLGSNGTIVRHGKDPVFLTRFAKPLDQVVDDQLTLFGDMDGVEACDASSCWT